MASIKQWAAQSHGAAKFRRVSPEELHRLLKLCGSEKGVVDYLAKAYGLPSASIAPVVMDWLSELPAIAPPSRMRSAPGHLAPSSFDPINLSAEPIKPLPLGRPSQVQMLPIRTPPITAPVGASNIAAAMRAIDGRLNKFSQAKYSTNAKHATDLRGDASQRIAFDAGEFVRTSTLTGHQFLRPVPEEVPETLLAGESPANIAAAQERQKDALQAFMERQVHLHGGGGRLDTRHARAGGWNYG